VEPATVVAVAILVVEAGEVAWIDAADVVFTTGVLAVLVAEGLAVSVPQAAKVTLNNSIKTKGESNPGFDNLLNRPRWKEKGSFLYFVSCIYFDAFLLVKFIPKPDY